MCQGPPSARTHLAPSGAGHEGIPSTGKDVLLHLALLATTRKPQLLGASVGFGGGVFLIGCVTLAHSLSDLKAASFEWNLEQEQALHRSRLP